MNHWIKECRWLYNHFLEERINAYKDLGVRVNFNDQSIALPDLKKERPTLSNVCDSVLQDVVKRVDISFKNFFRRVKEAKEEKPELPRLRSKNEYNSLTFPGSKFRFINNKKLHIIKIGNIKINLHRPFKGIIKTCTIKRSHTDKWYISFTCKCKPKINNTTHEIYQPDRSIEPPPYQIVSEGGGSNPYIDITRKYKFW